RKNPMMTVLAGGLVVALLAAVAFGVVAAKRGTAAARAKEQDEAFTLLEKGRAALDKAFLYLYSRDVDYDDLVRRVDEGQKLIEDANAKSQRLALGSYLLGRAWHIKGCDDRAEASWRRTLDLDPVFAPAHF